MAPSYSFANEDLNVEQNIKEIDNYFLQEPENLPDEKIIALSKKILASRASYPTQTLGKTFILLADIANNKGDDSGALQFAIDGESLQGLDNSIKFNLWLKLAHGYFLQEKYERTNHFATSVILVAEYNDVLKYRLIALSYRAVIYASQNKRELALKDLEEVYLLSSANSQYDDDLRLLEILAIAYSYLGDYKTSLTMLNKLIMLKFDLERLTNIDQTYLHLARTYFQLNLLDDAYNAFWEAQKYSKEKNDIIRVAYAELGLAEVLLKQKKYHNSHDWLLSASAIFNEKHLSKPYLTSLILLAETAQLLDNKALYQHYLQIAELMARDVILTKKQSKLLLLLSEMYRKSGDYKNALLIQERYIELLQQFYQNLGSSLAIYPEHWSSTDEKYLNPLASENAPWESSQHKDKDTARENRIIILVVVIIMLLIILVFFGLRQRALRLNKVYDEVEQPLSFLATPSQTKRNYQLNYKMARKYGYPLAVGYLSVINWQELSFHFNRKIMLEVSKTLAILLNESKGEFDEAGEINEGEYLLLSPHQGEDEIAIKLNSLAEAIKVRFFANLGDYSVKIGYAYGLPTAQDIDPYIFLSRLSETTKT